MTQLKINDTVYSFIGETLCQFKVTEFLDDLRLWGVNENETFCVYIKYCYPSRVEAAIGLAKALEDIENDHHGRG